MLRRLFKSDTKFHRTFLLFQLVGDTQDVTSALHRNKAGVIGISLSFMVSELPCFTVWKRIQSARVTGSCPDWS